MRVPYNPLLIKTETNPCCCKLAVLCSSIGSNYLLNSKTPISVKRKEADLSNDISRTVMSTSSVWRQVPSVASQILTVLSPDADARCLPSCQKTTDLTQSLWPSSVWRQLLHWCAMVGRSCTYWGFSCLKCSRIKLRVGLNTTAEVYA